MIGHCGNSSILYSFDSMKVLPSAREPNPKRGLRSGRKYVFSSKNEEEHFQVN